uniref:Dual specificity phosphatase 13a n=1 Tax=Cyprinus carpio TaxID=7962 RepID=A0A8C2K4Q6_CYPCA
CHNSQGILSGMIFHKKPSVFILMIWPTGHVNQVWPNVYIGNEYHETSQCCIIWITHIVNAASGPPHVNTGPLEADDSSDFILSVFFYPTQQGLYEVFAHCLMGVSRSATLVLAFLMICEDLTLMEAIKAVRQHRDSCPNLGFLNQLRHLDMTGSQNKWQVFKFLPDEIYFELVSK